MKKLIIFSLMLFMVSSVAMAQSSSMTDDQVMQFVVKEHGSGTSNAQIVTKLMQRGVDISQIRRVRNRYERKPNKAALPALQEKSHQTARAYVPTMVKPVKIMGKRQIKRPATTATIESKASATTPIIIHTTIMTKSTWICRMKCMASILTLHRCSAICWLNRSTIARRSSVATSLIIRS